MRRLPKPPWPPVFPDAMPALRSAVECALLLLLALQAARLLWLVATPPAAPLMPVAALAQSGAAAASVALAFDPFHPASQAAGSQARVSGLRLHGVRVAGDESSAILSAGDGRQSAYRQGEEVAPGIRLQAVRHDHVQLRTGAGTRQLALESAPPAAAAPAPAPTPGALPASIPRSPAADAAGATVDPQALLAQTGLRARSEGGRVTGYTVIPRGDGELLRQAGLQAGDVLTAINGEQLTPERLGELDSLLSGQPQLRLTVQRDGQPHTLTVRTPSP